MPGKKTRKVGRLEEDGSFRSKSGRVKDAESGKWRRPVAARSRVAKKKRG